MQEPYIPRNEYLSKIEPYIGKEPIKALVGQRRVGKSYLLHQIRDMLAQRFPRAPIVQINKELHEFGHVRTDEDLVRYVSAAVGKARRACLLIDEVQEIADFEKGLKSLAAEGRYDIYITGSNARLLSGELATYLAGRCVEIEVYGLSSSEFLEFHRLEDTDDTFLSYLRYGGLPYLRNLVLEETVVYDYLRNIHAAILYRDVVARSRLRNIEFLERLVEFLADNTGSLVSANRISDFLKSQRVTISPNVILQYLSSLVAAFFVYRVRRSAITGRKRFEIGEKYYFGDLGLRNSIVGYRLADIGQMLENVVFLHLKRVGFEVTVGSEGGREVDFVCRRGGQKVYVQVAYLIADEKVHEREFGNLLAIPDNYPKYVVSMDPAAGGEFKGIHHFHVREFLSEIATL